MKVLGLGLGPFGKGSTGLISSTQRRMLAYAEHFDRLFLVVKTSRNQPGSVSRTGRSLVVLPTATRWRWQALIKMERMANHVVAKHRVSVIFAQEPLWTGLVGLLTKIRYGIPLNISLHNTVSEYRGQRLFFPIVRRVIDAADTVRCVNSTDRQTVIEVWGKKPEDVFLLPIGVSTDFFHFHGRNGGDTGSALPSRTGVVLYLGRLVREKDVPTLLKAFKEVVDAHPSTRLHIAGSGPEEPQLRALAESIGIQHRVRFLGAIDERDVPSVIQGADVLVLPSRYESYGRVVVEAGALGKPVVASDVEGPRDMIVNGSTGFLVRPGDAEAFAEKTIALLSDHDLRYCMGNAARRKIVADCSNYDVVCGMVGMLRHTADKIRLRTHSAGGCQRSG